MIERQKAVNGSIKRNSQLIVKFAKREGYNQRETSITARRTFLYAGLNGVLGETLYMKQPEEFVEDPDKVYLLEKTLYG